MPADIDMIDVTLDDQNKEDEKVIKAIISELNIIYHAVPNVDLKSLSRLKLAYVKKNVSEPVLKRCIQVFVNATAPGTHDTKSSNQQQALEGINVASLIGKDVVLEALNGGKKTHNTVDKLDSKLEALFDAVVQKKDYPEVTFFFAILVMDFMLNRQKLGMELCTRFITQLTVSVGNQNRRTLDFFASRIYQYFSLITDDSELIRNDLLAIYRTSCLRHDFQIQAVVLNLILRNYLKQNLHEQASQFVSKTSFPVEGNTSCTKGGSGNTNGGGGGTGGSGNEFARYLFYIGRMKSIQMNYSEAHAKLTQALRKAPQGNIALGFKVIAWKFALTVELLMGNIPERKYFLVKEMAVYLKPYEEIAQAVRGGSIPEFERVVAKNIDTYKEDNTLTLINRLRYIVLKTGLRKINHSYSRISFADIAAKLGLESEEDAACICSKAISDSVINATLDHDKKCLLSKSVSDTYSTDAPQSELHKRIAFCLQLHNDCIRSMEYPSKDGVKGENGGNANGDDRIDLDQLLAEMEDDDDIDML